MNNRELIIDHVREDLRDEVKLFTELCSDEEIESILKLSDTVKCLEIEHLMCVMVIDDRASFDDFKGWEIEGSFMLNLELEKRKNDNE